MSDRLPTYSLDSLLPEQQQRLLFWQFIMGIITCSTASQLLVSMGVAGWGVALFSWISMMLAWGLLLSCVVRKISASQVWNMGAVVQLLLITWPCVVILISKQPGFFWLFWPVALIVGVGAIPWKTSHLLMLIIVYVAFGIALVEKLSLGSLVALLFCAALLFSCFLHIYNKRRLKEKTMLLSFGEHISDLTTESEILRVFAEHVIHLFNTRGALIVDSLGSVELVENGIVKHVEGQSVDISEILKDAKELPVEHSGVDVFLIYDLPIDISSSKSWASSGSFSNGLLFVVAIELKDTGSDSELKNPGILLPLNEPFANLFRYNELNTVSGLARTLRLKLLAIIAKKLGDDRHYSFERWQQQREYELGALVHDINNTVQDLTLLCENILEKSSEKHGEDSELVDQIQRIEGIARCVATVVSDAKRKRELERMDDLRPREHVHVQPVIEELASFAILRAERKRIEVKVEIPGDEELWIKISVREHLETILRNLLINAITYSDAGTEVAISLSFDEEFVLISVVDQGPGIAAEELSSVFEPGYRGVHAKSVGGGLGLGLAESRRVAEAAGGSLEVSSDGIGEGATFSVKLPRHSAPTRSLTDSRWALLVDDEPPIVDFYAKLARGLSLTPYVANSVQSALEVIDQYGQPSIAITDVHLGGSNGLDLVRSLRDSFGESLPILVISGLADEQVSVEAREAGATDVVRKPVGRRALFARIQSLLG